MKQSFYIILFFNLLLVLSCSNNDDNNIESSAPVAVTFSVTLPDAEEVHTRAYGDKVIKNLTVLVFDNANKFMERIDVDEADITANTGNVKFNIILDATTENRTLHLIANARTADGLTDRINFSGVTTGLTEVNAIPGLTTNAITATGDQALLNNITPLIMWGRASLNGVSLTTKVNNVKLLRSVASVEMKKATATAANGLNDFTIHKFAVHNGCGIGKITAAAYNSEVTATPTTGNPTTFTAFDYTKAWTETTDPVAYIYERNCTSSNYMSVILYASYKGQAGYYRVALANGDTPVNILRNHKYIITVTSVNGPGYTSAATAASSGPSNALKATLTVQETETYPFIDANSQSWMGLTNNVFQLVSNSSGTKTADLGILYVSRSGVTPVPTVTGSGLTVSATLISGTKYRLVGTFTSYNNSTVTVKCDDLSLDMQVSCVNFSSLASDTDSYVMDLIGSYTNWSAWIPEPATNKRVHLHSSASTAGALTSNAGDGMQTELNGRYGGKGYLHIHKASGQKDEVWTSGASGASVVARKTMVVQ